jgi:hypothetical protein
LFGAPRDFRATPTHAFAIFAYVFSCPAWERRRKAFQLTSRRHHGLALGRQRVERFRQSRKRGDVRVRLLARRYPSLPDWNPIRLWVPSQNGLLHNPARASARRGHGRRRSRLALTL